MWGHACIIGGGVVVGQGWVGGWGVGLMCSKGEVGLPQCDLMVSEFSLHASLIHM